MLKSKKFNQYKYGENTNYQLLHGDSIELMSKIQKESIDMIFADPPYFLSNNGITCKSGRMVSVNKAEWDMGMSLEEKHRFNRKWIKRCHRVLKPNGTIWISGTLHNIYSIGYALEQEGFKILNNITWQKTNPPPNLGCRTFTHSTETVLWAKKDIKKSKYTFNYDIMKEYNGGKQMKDVWLGSTTKKSEKEKGKHPTQKPLYLLERIIEASTKKGDLILDPFVGSGTTGVVAVGKERYFIGIDMNMDYLKLSEERINEVCQEVLMNG